jgi:hypothetical protein
MLWRHDYDDDSLAKLERLWSARPLDDVDVRLTTDAVRSYCINGLATPRALQAYPSWPTMTNDKRKNMNNTTFETKSTANRLVYHGRNPIR